MRHTKTNLLITIFFILTFTIYGMLSEIRVRVNDGSTSTLIEVYTYSYASGGYIFFDQGYSVIDTNPYHFQAKCDVGDNNTSNPTWQPLSFNSRYLIRIGNRYCRINIGSHTGTPDFDLKYLNGTFSEITGYPHGIITLVEQGNWNTKTVIVKNSFNAGNVKIDGILYQNVGSNGVTKHFGTPTFPHKLEAINNQSHSGYVRIFDEWQKENVGVSSTLSHSIQAESATYKANFLKQFNLTFKNSFVGGGNGGQIKVNGDTVSSPTNSVHVIETNDISFEAVNQTINGIAYTFDEWDNGSTSKSRIVTPTDHEDYIASFNGKPVGVGNSVTFNSGAPTGTPVKLYWNDNVNSTVKYKIYRKHGKFGSTHLIATVNSNVGTYTDYDMAHTNNTSSNNLTWYDVRAYYPTESSSADTDLSALYAEWLPKQSNGANDSTSAQIIKEYSITNFPNPFNPTTIIYYKLKERGNVVVKVYDMLGKEVAVLVNEAKSMGEYVTKFNGSNLSSGVYIMTMQINNFSTSKKLLLTK